ncbi:hypothetical protein [Novosphingobium sp. 9U]|uniref:hypothetical protein n=1 Tax=Novosphingobium sp. 9U TaxID=2653158 RepID=UPI0012F182CB|nr:hypothetical protein [Novosphingobium sp. 9U]VWX50871.1 membrane hypothetical protein [Novosphingobium sp. 9U]
MKAVDEVLAFIRRHAPALVAHLLFLVWLGFFVIDPRAVADGGASLPLLWFQIETPLQSMGLSLERWYVAAGLLVAYFTLFEWVQGVVTTVPLLRVVHGWRYPADLMAAACQTLRLPPEYWRVMEAIDSCTRRAEDRVRQSGQRHPYQWLIDRSAVLFRYYGAVLIALAGSIAWALLGATRARSPERVWLTIALLVAIAVGLRLAIRLKHAERRARIAGWALSEQRRDQGELAHDPLSEVRLSAMLTRAAIEEAFARHPASWLMRWTQRLPDKQRRKVRDLFTMPDTSIGEQRWRLLSSQLMRHPDEVLIPPAALKVDAFTGRFAALLECTGSGLSVLVPGGLGLAPAAQEGGQTYSFARRCHGRDDVAIELSLWSGFEEPYAKPTLRALVPGGIGFLVALGTRPIEQLAQHNFPDNPILARSLARDLTAEQWTAIEKAETVFVDDVALARELPVTPGGSYLLAARTRQGADVELVFQCFRVAGTNKLLVAWRILEVSRQATSQTIPPWWRPAAWRGLRRSAVRTEKRS